MHVTTGLKTFDVPPPSSETTRGLNTVFALVGAADATVLHFMALYLFERGFDPSGIGIVLAAAALGATSRPHRSGRSSSCSGNL